MAKVVGPCFSLSARKSLKKILTFQRRPSGHAISPHRKPGDRAPFSPSAKQTTQRNAIGALVAAWKALSAEVKALWDAAAKEVGYIGTGYHFYLHKGGVGGFIPPPVVASLLLEDGAKMLLETGDKILLDEE